LLGRNIKREMSNTQVILIVLITVLSSLLEGINNSLISARKGFESFKWNEHILFVLQRGCWLLVFFVLLHWKEALLLSIIYALHFSFFHNGSYGESMKKLGYKKYSWTYSSPDSTARIELNFRIRTILFILAVLILTYILINPCI
jgi:hypothetical protein